MDTQTIQVPISLLRGELTYLQKLLLAFFNEETACYATNAEIGKIFDTAPTVIAHRISELKHKGYLHVYYVNGAWRMVSLTDKAKEEYFQCK